MKQKIISPSRPLQGHELTGLSAVVVNYDVFIIDLWGVIYNGKNVFDAAFEVLLKLKELNKVVYLTTNSPRSRDQAITVLEKMGLGHHLFTELITAGQKTLELFEMYIIEPEKKRPLHTLFIDHDRVCRWGERAGLIESRGVEKADIILAIHMDESLLVPDPYVPLFRQAIERDLLFVCANPDKYIMEEEIKRARVGILSDLYRAMGGRVMEVGKPHPIMFEEVMTAHRGKSTLLIGDSLVTDIRAAQYIGVDSLLITKGYHREEFHSMADVKRGTIYDTYGIVPTYVCEELSW
ncbi:MAG: TIGR01459 family HAD-type hydrolase [Candidatus Paracaedibacteraceae bacterium]|nr:TIGR01459 family HAD-type hydrolase [Candidatus Paracaedibacteraceae bacterium]